MEEQREHDYLRKEIECNMEVVRKANSVLYVGITAVFAWAITMHNSAICLLAYCVIIPIYYIVLDYNIAIMKIGAYLFVFHNEKWERRLHKVNVNRIINRHDSSYRNSFIYASIFTTILFFVLLDYSQIGSIEIIQIIICIALLLWFTIYIFLQKNNDIVKQAYINAWEDIKRNENN